MKNLAVVKEADNYIRSELEEAGIQIVEGPQSDGEVKYTLTGKLGPWTLSRAWYYWMANASDGEGVPLEVAEELSNRDYPLNHDRFPGIKYFHVVRVAGMAGGDDPRNWAKHYDANGCELVVDPKGKQEADYIAFLKRHPRMKQDAEKLRFVQSLDGVVEKSVVGSYHIDTQEGLNEFVKTVKKLL